MSQIHEIILALGLIREALKYRNVVILQWASIRGLIALTFSLYFLVVEIIVLHLNLILNRRRTLTRPQSNAYFWTVVASFPLCILNALVSLALCLTIKESDALLAMENSLLEAMSSYGSNQDIKSRLDRMQIELECCGAKSYEEWYQAGWYGAHSDTKLLAVDDVPFSCCSNALHLPCIHHDLLSGSLNYKYYVSETEVTLWKVGCGQVMTEQFYKATLQLTWYNLLFAIFHMFILVIGRLIQTGDSHFFSLNIHAVWILRKVEGVPPHFKGATRDKQYECKEKKPTKWFFGRSKMTNISKQSRSVDDKAFLTLAGRGEERPLLEDHDKEKLYKGAESEEERLIVEQQERQLLTSKEKRMKAKWVSVKGKWEKQKIGEFKKKGHEYTRPP